MRPTKDILRPVDGEARQLARALIRAARHGSLATLVPEDGAPVASRALVASDESGRPLLLISDLSLHGRALRADPRCSLLLGEPGSGDPLAHPRITLFGTARELIGEDRDAARARFTARHPSAAVYCDFADFRFLRMEISGANLNAGFARTYAMEPDDLVDAPRPDLRERLVRAMEHMNADHADAVQAIAETRAAAHGEGWRIVTVDPTGFEIARADDLRRAFFEAPIAAVDDIRGAFVALVPRG